MRNGAEMSSRGVEFSGCVVALITPFRDGAVDYDALRRSVDWQISQGVPVLSPAGTTGEGSTLTQDEHERLIATVVEQTAGRARVLAATGSNATAATIRMTQFAARTGCDGALVVTPYYNRPTQEGLFAHFARIAEAVSLPLFLSNAPARTRCNLEPDTVERLAADSRVVGIEEASGSLDQVSEIVTRTDLTVLAGDDRLTLPMLALGAEGVVSAVANLVPRDVISLLDSFLGGRINEARRRHAHLFPLYRALLGQDANPIPVKQALGLLDRSNGELRLPLCPPEARELETLRQILILYGLPAAAATGAPARA